MNLLPSPPTRIGRMPGSDRDPNNPSGTVRAYGQPTTR
nr:MAG TPA: hypothetical protein [Caudoviricetes sp.]